MYGPIPDGPMQTQPDATDCRWETSQLAPQRASRSSRPSTPVIDVQGGSLEEAKEDRWGTDLSTLQGLSSSNTCSAPLPVAFQAAPWPRPGDAVPTRLEELETLDGDVPLPRLVPWRDRVTFAEFITVFPPRRLHTYPRMAAAIPTMHITPSDSSDIEHLVSHCGEGCQRFEQDLQTRTDEVQDINWQIWATEQLVVQLYQMEEEGNDIGFDAAQLAQAVSCARDEIEDLQKRLEGLRRQGREAVLDGLGYGRASTQPDVEVGVDCEVLVPHPQSRQPRPFGLLEADPALIPPSDPEAPFLSPRDSIMVPDWFPVFVNARRHTSSDPEDFQKRFVDYLTLVSNLQIACGNSPLPQELALRPVWDKVWHEPSDVWSTPQRRRYGGWWRCRTGAEAPDEEVMCLSCRGQPPISSLPMDQRERQARARLEELERDVQAAMGIVARKDRDILARRWKGEDV